VSVLSKYHRQVEFDMKGRGWDLLDFWRGRMTARQLDVAVMGVLEARGATWRAIIGGPHQRAEDILADIVDTLAAAN
jgi:hypothetical protein